MTAAIPPIQRIAVGRPAEIDDRFRNGVLAIGSFDGVHRGHQALISQAAATAAKLGTKAIALTFEPHPRTVLQPDAPFFRRGTPTWELHPEVAGRPRDHLVEKQLPGSFTGTDLETWLRSQDVTHVTIAGYMTHMCCDTTAREAFHRGFGVEFLSDATGTLPLSNAAGTVTAEELHRSVLVAQQMLLAEVVVAVSAWQAGPALSGRAIPETHQPNIVALGQLLYSRYLLPFELAGLIRELEYLTPPLEFQSVERGDPLPYTLPLEKRREVGLERETWKLEVIPDGTTAAIRPPGSPTESTSPWGTTYMTMASTSSQGLTPTEYQREQGLPKARKTRPPLPVPSNVS